MKNKAMIAVIAAILVVLAGVLFFNKKEAQQTPLPDPTETTEATETPEPTAAPEATATPPAETEQPIPSTQPNTTKTIDEVWEMTVDILMAAEFFHKEFSWQTQYISKNGQLYENASSEYITPDKLTNLTDMNPAFAEENVLILYLRPDAFAENSADISDGDNLVFYTAYETSDGMAVAGPRIQEVIPKAQFDEVLAQYKWEQGEIKRYSADDEEMQKIVDVLTKLEGGALDIRHLARDDKHASAVVSPQASPQSVKEYALINQNGEWKVSLPDIESLEQKFVSISFALPDMNQELVPRYQLYSDLKHMKSNFSALVSALRNSGSLYESDGEPTFASGDDDFVYLEFATSELKLFGCFDNESQQWVMYPVLDYAHAEMYMKDNARLDHPPYFYIKEN